ncbi:MAG: serine hydrolase [Kofleriaceae bacterium]|nr:serine hydrolase [Kofleriaceae bacterium]
MTAGLVELLSAAVDGGLGSAAALSIGDGGREVERVVLGTEQRVPGPGPAIDEHTLFDLASLTKPMATAAVAMALVGAGRLDLADPIRRHLPASASPACVADLLGHGAGCAAHVEFFHEVWTIADLAQARAALLARAAATPLAYPPGTTTTYSDLGYLQAGAVLEHAGGARLDELVAGLVAGPLGLTGLRFVDRASTGRPARVVATEVDPRRGGLVRGLVHDENAHAGGGVTGHAGLFGSITDVAGFAAAMTQLGAGHDAGPLRADVATRFLTSAAAPGTSWRLGWDTPSTTPGISHAGDRWPRVGAVGHLGFTGTSLWLDLPRQRWVALLTNRVHPRREDTADAIRTLRRAVGDAAVALLGG